MPADSEVRSLTFTNPPGNYDPKTKGYSHWPSSGRERRVWGRLGIAALGSIGTAVYRGRVSTPSPPTPRPSGRGGPRRPRRPEAAANGLSDGAAPICSNTPAKPSPLG